MQFYKLKKIFKTENLFLILIILFILFVAFQLPRDPDMGWHLRNGEYLVNHNFQVPNHDIYSYTMPDFPLIMHEWLSDIIMFLLDKYFGLISLMIIFTFISALPFYLVARSIKSPLSYQLIAVLLGIIATMAVVGVRPQMITLLGLALNIFILYRFKNNVNSNLIYFFPFIYLLWTNLHGGFIIGLFFIFIFISVELFKIVLNKLNKKYNFFKFRFDTFEIKDVIKLIFVFGLSVLATFFNPYHFRLYHEIFTTAFDTYAKGYISEWLPVKINDPLSRLFLIYSTFMLFLIIFSLKKIDFTYLIITIIFFFVSISSWRNLPFFILISIPFWIYLVEYLTADKLQKILKQKWLLLIMVVFFIVFINQKLNAFLPIIKSQELYAQEFAYPYQAVNFLKTNPLDGKMFNEYNWGGYLIWQYPEKKVFIDGRMPSWRLKRNNGETQEILKDFRILRDGQEGWDLLLLKYQFDFTLLYRGAPLSFELKKLGWEKIYEDDLTEIMKKVK